jgi:hypothetical protein
MFNNTDTIRQYTTIRYSKFKITTRFDCTRQPTSDRMFQKCKKKANYIAVLDI